jgi:hypothetical protein
MSDEAGTWLRYAEENLRSARLLLEHGLLNPCLQNAQQAVEKALKAILIARAIPLRRTHSIQRSISVQVTEANVGSGPRAHPRGASPFLCFEEPHSGSNMQHGDLMSNKRRKSTRLYGEQN